MSTRVLFSALALALISLQQGCTTTDGAGTDAIERDGAQLSMATVRNEWFNDLNRVNPQLHDTLLESLYLSRQHRREVFILKRTFAAGNATQAAVFLYVPSWERGGPENLMSVDFGTRTFLLDHFSADDGPTMEQVRDRLFDTQRIEIIKRDLGIFGVK